MSIHLEKDNLRLKHRLKSLTDEASYNEAVLKRFHDRELILLTSASLVELLHNFTGGLRRSFGLQDISLVLYDPQDELAQLLIHHGVTTESFPSIRFASSHEEYSHYFDHHHHPWLGPWQSERHQPLFRKQGLRSVALLPLVLRDKLAGCLNLGSNDPLRFTPHHATDFLQRLATIGAVCLENAANRERIVLNGLTDHLTGLYNRSYLQRRLGEEISRAQRYDQPLSCLFLDIDHFKQVNDNHGHAAGDEVLREVAQRVKSMLRASDVATRFGGEEFTLLLPQTSAAEAQHLAERIRCEVNQTPVQTGNGESLRVTCSIGVAELAASDITDAEKIGDRLLNAADTALYQAKETGRDRVVVSGSFSVG